MQTQGDGGGPVLRVRVVRQIQRHRQRQSRSAQLERGRTSPSETGGQQQREVAPARHAAEPLARRAQCQARFPVRVGFIAAAPVDRDQPYTNTTATPTASPLPQRVAVADTSVRGSLAPGHVPPSTSDSAKTEVAEHKQDDHDKSDEPNDSVHVRLPSESELDGNPRSATPRRKRNGSRLGRGLVAAPALRR